LWKGEAVEWKDACTSFTNAADLSGTAEHMTLKKKDIFN
jgi:hypothetical protein